MESLETNVKEQEDPLEREEETFLKEVENTHPEFTYFKNEMERLHQSFLKERDFFNQITAETKESLQNEGEEINPSLENDLESFFPGIQEAFHLAFLKLSTAFLDKEVSQEDIEKAFSDVFVLSQTLDSLITGKLQSFQNQNHHPLFSQDFFRIYFQQSEQKEKEVVPIQLVIKPFFKQSPYTEATINIKYADRDISVRLDRSHYGLGVDIDSEAINKVTAKADQILKSQNMNQWQNFAQKLREKSPDTHHFYTFQFQSVDKTKPQLIDKLFAKFSLKFLKGLMDKYDFINVHPFLKKDYNQIILKEIYG